MKIDKESEISLLLAATYGMLCRFKKYMTSDELDKFLKLEESINKIFYHKEK